MPNTYKLLPGWFKVGAEQGFAYMAVILDLEDNYNDYPAFFHTHEECQNDINVFDTLYRCGHERLMEVYDLSQPFEAQWKVPRHFALKPKSFQDD